MKRPEKVDSFGALRREAGRRLALLQILLSSPVSWHEYADRVYKRADARKKARAGSLSFAAVRVLPEAFWKTGKFIFCAYLPHHECRRRERLSCI
ncbi:unnamed protein product [Rangifer tarandus platyrhynchus]|uniref:Uncharacterized protein n=1 Tax=Rangifer tarandus platyrhynchus TaxID=3082113 RepID=A0ABN8XHZ2_RANTA|nr:unnamed protein product [Rangifer tarandus platyrhynchus]